MLSFNNLIPIVILQLKVDLKVALVLNLLRITLGSSGAIPVTLKALLVFFLLK